MKTINISPQELRSRNMDEIYSSTKGQKTGFYHYTSLETAKNILNTCEKSYFFLSPISRANDIHEIKLHQNDSNSTFILCFCNSESENIPMWYLYAGITGKGVNIGLTPCGMKSFIDSIDCVYCVNQDGSILDAPLSHNDYELEYGWVFYGKARTFIYRNKRYKLSKSADEFYDGNYFIKDLEWHYEKEFRIVIRLKSPKLISDPPERIAIELKKSSLIKKGSLKVKYGPELAVESYLGLPSNKVNRSKLAVQMNLLQRNQNSIIKEFPELCEKFDIETLVHMRDKIENILRLNSSIKEEKKELVLSGV